MSTCPDISVALRDRKVYAARTVATDWVILGSDKMRMARKKMRVSADEIALRMARNGAPIVPRTYLRWEDRGEVPRDKLPPLAAILGLDLEKILIDQPTRVQWQQVSEVLAEVATAMQALVALLAEQREVVGRLETVAAALQEREAASSRS